MNHWAHVPFKHSTFLIFLSSFSRQSWGLWASLTLASSIPMDVMLKNGGGWLHCIILRAEALLELYVVYPSWRWTSRNMQHTTSYPPSFLLLLVGLHLLHCDRVCLLSALATSFLYLSLVPHLQLIVDCSQSVDCYSAWYDFSTVDDCVWLNISYPVPSVLGSPHLFFFLERALWRGRPQCNILGLSV